MAADPVGWIEVVGLDRVDAWAETERERVELFAVAPGTSDPLTNHSCWIIAGSIESTQRFAGLSKDWELLNQESSGSTFR